MQKRKQEKSSDPPTMIDSFQEFILKMRILRFGPVIVNFEGHKGRDKISIMGRIFGEVELADRPHSLSAPSLCHPLSALRPLDSHRLRPISTSKPIPAKGSISFGMF